MDAGVSAHAPVAEHNQTMKCYAIQLSSIYTYNAGHFNFTWIISYAVLICVQRYQQTTKKRTNTVQLINVQFLNFQNKYLSMTIVRHVVTLYPSVTGFYIEVVRRCYV